MPISNCLFLTGAVTLIFVFAIHMVLLYVYIGKSPLPYAKLIEWGYGMAAVIMFISAVLKSWGL